LGHGLGLRADGSVAAWGQNDRGQCDVPSPNEGFIAVAAGDYHSLAVREDGSIAA
jgi:alpha-tubulin suppressor-like RCC1 family protein